MIKHLFHRLLKRHHFWRYVGFDELSQIYISSFFRTMAISLVGIFIPIFLHDLGYGLIGVFVFHMTYFVVRTIIHLPVGYLIALIGPKHSILISFIAQLTTSLMFLLLPNYDIPLLLIAAVFAIANTLFFVAYHVDFSKVKHSEHSGKEMGFANVVQRIGGALGPVTGGVVATLFGPQYIFLVMSVMLFMGVLPLFTTAEPMKVHQKIRFRKFPVSSIKRDLVSYVGLTVPHHLAVSLWPFFLALYALGSNVYLELGALSSIAFLVSIMTAFVIGRVVDKGKGRSLLRIASVTDMFVQLMKPFVNSFPFALTLNSVGESTAIAMRITYHKGMYDAADGHPGNRIVYVSIMELAGALAKAIIWAIMLLIGVWAGFEVAFVAGFIIAGVASVITLAERFPALGR